MVSVETWPSFAWTISVHRLARSYVAGDFAIFGSLLGRLLAMGAAIGICGMIVSNWRDAKFLPFCSGRVRERADLLPWIMLLGVVYMASLWIRVDRGRYYNSQSYEYSGQHHTCYCCYWLVIPQDSGVIIAMLAGCTTRGSAVVLAFGMRMRVHPRTERVEPA